MKGSILATTVAVMLLAGPAFGHAKLLHSVPSADAQLQAVPSSLTLGFSENVRLAVVTLTSGGKIIPVPIDRTAPAAAQVSVALPALKAGTYEVHWSALSTDDGHVTKGTFSFAIVGAAVAPAH